MESSKLTTGDNIMTDEVYCTNQDWVDSTDLSPYGHMSNAEKCIALKASIKGFHEHYFFQEDESVLISRCKAIRELYAAIDGLKAFRYFTSDVEGIIETVEGFKDGE